MNLKDWFNIYAPNTTRLTTTGVIHIAYNPHFVFGQNGFRSHLKGLKELPLKSYEILECLGLCDYKGYLCIEKINKYLNKYNYTSTVEYKEPNEEGYRRYMLRIIGKVNG